MADDELELRRYAERAREVRERVLRSLTDEEFRGFQAMRLEEKRAFLRARVEALLDQVLVDHEEEARESMTPEEWRDLERLPSPERRERLRKRLRDRLERRLDLGIDRAIAEGCLGPQDAERIRREPPDAKAELLLRLRREHLERLPGDSPPGPHGRFHGGLPGGPADLRDEEFRRREETRRWREKIRPHDDAPRRPPPDRPRPDGERQRPRPPGPPPDRPPEGRPGHGRPPGPPPEEEGRPAERPPRGG